MYGRVTKTKGPVRSQRPVHRGRITAHDLRQEKGAESALFRSETGRWVVVDIDTRTSSVEGFKGEAQGEGDVSTSGS